MNIELNPFKNLNEQSVINLTPSSQTFLNARNGIGFSNIINSVTNGITNILGGGVSGVIGSATGGANSIVQTVSPGVNSLLSNPASVQAVSGIFAPTQQMGSLFGQTNGTTTTVSANGSIFIGIGAVILVVLLIFKK